MTETLGLNLLAIIACMVALWMISVPLRNSSIVDPFWGVGFVLVAIISYVLLDERGPRATLLLTMVAIWGLRLSGYLSWRNLGHGEDPRYARMRKYHGDAFWWRSLFIVFLLQGVLLWFIALPVQLGMLEPSTSLRTLDWVGVGIWVIGLLFETVGDFQLAAFRARPENKGRVLDRGLWRFTRHPNYFGDACIWWGVYVVAVAAGAWETFLSPLVMTLLLMYVSGVRLTEKTITSRRPEYVAYQRRTNAFFPGLPRS